MSIADRELLDDLRELPEKAAVERRACVPAQSEGEPRGLSPRCCQAPRKQAGEEGAGFTTLLRPEGFPHASTQRGGKRAHSLRPQPRFNPISTGYYLRARCRGCESDAG